MIIVTGGTGRLGSQIVTQLLDRVPADQSASASATSPRPRTSPHAECACEPETSPIPTASTTPSRVPTRCSSCPQPSADRGPPRPTGPPSRPRCEPEPRGSSTPATRQLPRRRCSRPAPACRRPRRSLPTRTSPGRRCATASTPAPSSLRPGRARDRGAAPSGGRAVLLDCPRRPRGGRRHRAHPGGRARRRVSRPDRPEQLDFADVARILGEVVGRRIERVVVDDEVWRASAIERGLPAPAADFTLGMFRAARRGEFAVTDPTLETLLGRPAISARHDDRGDRGGTSLNALSPSGAAPRPARA